MRNKIENNAVTGKESLQQIKTQMMHYRGNGLSHKLGFLGIAFSVLGAFICLNSFNPDMLGFLKILMNIAILLFGFMCCEKAKSYSKQASIVLIGIGGVCIARIFWVPLNLIIWYNKYISAREIVNNNEVLQADKQAALSTIAQAKKYIGKTITDFYEGAGNVNWLPADGNLRGILAMVLFACAAAAFLSSGIIGYMRSKKFHESLENKK